MEEYYSEYINAVAFDEDSNLFIKFSTLYADGNYKVNIDKLSGYIERLGFMKIYQSIIDMDIHFFGLIYYTLFEKLSLTEEAEKLERLNDRLNRSIRNIKKEPNHVKTPSCLKYIRVRIDESLKVYKDLFV